MVYLRHLDTEIRIFYWKLTVLRNPFVHIQHVLKAVIFIIRPTPAVGNKKPRPLKFLVIVCV